MPRQLRPLAGLLDHEAPAYDTTLVPGTHVSRMCIDTARRWASSGGNGVNRGAPILVATCLAFGAENFLPERVPAQIILTPRIIQIDQVKCAELQSISGDKLDRLLVYFNGYIDGMRRHTVWDERQVAELIDKAIGYCKADPSESVLSAFTRASR